MSIYWIYLSVNGTEVIVLFKTLGQFETSSKNIAFLFSFVCKITWNVLNFFTFLIIFPQILEENYWNGSFGDDRWDYDIGWLTFSYPYFLVIHVFDDFNNVLSNIGNNYISLLPRFFLVKSVSSILRSVGFSLIKRYCHA